MTATCEACGQRIRAATWTVVVNVADRPTRRYHGQCFVDSREAGQDRKAAATT
jgi:hypothetical protein